jgi:hypothetical protein
MLNQIRCTGFKQKKKSRRLDQLRVLYSTTKMDEKKTLTYSLPERPRSSGYKRKVMIGSDKSRRNVFKTQAAK